MKQRINLIMATISLIGVTSLFTACGDSDTFTDPRDGQKYKTVKIGEQVWMAEGLKYEKTAYRTLEYGNEYLWDSALVSCPDGWHLPSKKELETVAYDTSFAGIWSSTVKEDFSLWAYGLLSNGKLEAISKNGSYLIMRVRCVLGKRAAYKKLNEYKGYKVVYVGNQIWMSDNLTIKTSNSICYLDDENECPKGRYYPYSEAINACPEGWHLPSKSEAIKFINRLKKANSTIKSTYGYYSSKTEQFENFWGNGMLWTSTLGFVIRDKPDVWEGASIIKGDGLKFAVRCIANAEDKMEE